MAIDRNKLEDLLKQLPDKLQDDVLHFAESLLQRNDRGSARVNDNASAAAVARRQLEKLAAEQSVRPISDFDSLRADFWPEDESIDDFVRTVRERRRDSGGGALNSA